MWQLVAAVASAAMSKHSANKANANAERQADIANDAQQASLNFAKETYADWKDTFGDIQTNLKDYFNNLTPADRNLYVPRDVAAEIRGETAQSLQFFEQEKNKALESVRQTLDQRGIGTSGLAAQMEAEAGGFGAVNRAAIRREGAVRERDLTRQEQLLERQATVQADQQVTAEKFDFLRAGLNTNPANNVQNSYNSIANQQSSYAASAASAAGTAANASSRAIGDAILAGGDYMSNRPKTPAPVVESKASGPYVYDPNNP